MTNVPRGVRHQAVRSGRVKDPRKPASMTRPDDGSQQRAFREVQEWPIVRLSSIICVGLALLLPGCAAIPRQLPQPLYTVSAPIESYPDGTAKVCFAMQLSSPGECGGLPNSQLGSVRLPFAQAARTPGAYITPIMKLTGTWTGSSLALTMPATRTAAGTRPVTVWASTHAPSPAQLEGGRVTESGLRDQQRLMAGLNDLESRGIRVIDHGFESSGYVVTVVAGDQASIDLLRSRYNIQRIDSWLHRVP